jgi:hypothetical protein
VINITIADDIVIFFTNLSNPNAPLKKKGFSRGAAALFSVPEGVRARRKKRQREKVFQTKPERKFLCSLNSSLRPPRLCVKTPPHANRFTEFSGILLVF